MIKINRLARFFITYLGFSAFCMPVFAHSYHISSSHQKFVNEMIKNTKEVNNDILKDRTKLLKLDKQYKQTHTLSASNKQWLKSLASEYKAPSTNFAKHSTWTELEKRVDVIPPSLALAQSIQESGWGRSYLAKDAHNYFGQECGSTRTCYHSTDYRHFSKMQSAISAYAHNLNTNHAYRSLRNTRYSERVHHEKPNSLAMANGLTHYSVLKGRYIASIKKIIKEYDLKKYDTDLGTA